MKRLIMLAALPLILASCATTPLVTANEMTVAQKAQMQADWLQSCLLYNGAQKALVANIDKLSNEELKQALIITRQITPLCEVQPTDTLSAATAITAAVTKLTIMAGVQAIQQSQGVKP